MPLSDHEQRILEEIERRLAEDDPAFVEQVGRTDLYTHLARRIRLAVAFAETADVFIVERIEIHAGSTYFMTECVREAKEDRIPLFASQFSDGLP